MSSELELNGNGGGDTSSHEGDAIGVAVPVAQAVEPEAVGILSRLFAPFRFLFQPKRCGGVMASSPFSSIFAFLFGACVIGATILVLIVMDQMVEWKWSYGGLGSDSEGVIRRGFVEAWLELGTSRFSAAITSCFIVGVFVLWTLIITLVFAWMMLPVVHRSGSALRSLARSFWVAAGIVGPGAMCVLVLGLGIVLWTNGEEASRVNGGLLQERWVEELIITSLFVLHALAIGLLGRWTRLAAMGARRVEVDTATPPTCESCGYDLTHPPEGGRCPECGEATVLSLNPDARRAGVEWERQPSLGAWLSTSRLLLTHPARFYERLRMRGSETLGYRFAVLNFIALGILSAISILAMVAYVDRYIKPLEMFVSLAIGAVLPAVFAWLLHMLVGALAASLMLMRRQTRPFAHVSKVWQYESAFLWIAFIVGHGVAWSFAIGEEWVNRIYQALTGQFWPGVEVFFVLAVIVVLVSAWLVRYRRAIAVCRYANF